MLIGYIVNNNKKYLEMTQNSISMLRKYNQIISISVICIDEISLEFANFCKTYNVSTKIMPNLDINGYFQDNKVYLDEFDADQVLLMDSDTFVMGDVASLFEKYKEYDVVACKNDWVWSFGFQKEYMAETPLNSGVVLFRRAFKTFWATNMRKYAQDLKEGNTGLSRWLYTINENAYNREEFAFSILAGKFNVGIFDEKDCKLSKNPIDLQNFQHCTTIFHSFTHKWKECYQNLNKPKIKIFPYIKHGSLGTRITRKTRQ